MELTGNQLREVNMGEIWSQLKNYFSFFGLRLNCDVPIHRSLQIFTGKIVAICYSVINIKCISGRVKCITSVLY